MSGSKEETSRRIYVDMSLEQRQYLEVVGRSRSVGEASHGLSFDLLVDDNEIDPLCVPCKDARTVRGVPCMYGGNKP
jgi:hypothetical protein